MKKYIFIAFLLLNVVAVWPAHAETSTDEIPAVLQTLQSDCFEKYQKQFFDDKATLSYLSNTVVDLSQLGDISSQTGLTQEYLNSMGITQEYLDSLQAEVQQYQPDIQQTQTSSLQQGYHDLAQVNVDLAKCYEDKLANYPDLLANAQALEATAEQQLQTVDSFDFSTLSATPTMKTTVTVPAHRTKSLTIKTFCLDPYRHSPEDGEEYYLAASVNDLQDGKLCDVLKTAQADTIGNTAQTDTQFSIWNTANTQPTGTTALAAAKEAVTQEAKAEPITQASAVVKSVTDQAAKLPMVPVAATAVGFGSLFVLLVGGAMKAKAVVALPLKLAWVAGMLIAAGIGGFGIWLWLTPTAQAAQDNSVIQLTTANTLGLVAVEAVSSGDFSELNVTISNTTDIDLILDTSCAEFIPKHVDTTEAPDIDNIQIIEHGDDDTNLDENSNDNINLNENQNDNVNQNEDTNADDTFDVDPSNLDNLGYGSQRLGSGGYIDTSDAPEPDGPPEPEHTVDIEKLKKVMKDAWEYSRDKYLEDPTEAHLKEALKDLANCQLVGCEGGDTGIDDLTGPLEKNWEASRDKYLKDPTPENLKEALKDLAKCQWMGCSGGDVAGSDLGGAWQTNVNQSLTSFQGDQSAVNRANLIRSTEIGTMVSSDTSQATAALYSK